MAFLTGYCLVVGVDEKDGIPDHAVHCALLHISRVQDLVGKKTAVR